MDTFLKPALKVAVFVSGSGSNLQALIDAKLASELPIDIVGVISNKDKAYAITRAKNANIEVAVLSHTSSGKKMGMQTFEQHALDLLNQWQVDLVVLAGFMRVLSAEFISKSPSPIINLHPSLLPKYKGLDTHARVLLSKDDKHGCSVHLVTAELDAGQVLTQAVMTVPSGMTADRLQQKVHRLEHQLLPWTVKLIAQGVLPLAMLSNCMSFTHLPALPWRCLFDD